MTGGARRQPDWLGVPAALDRIVAAATAARTATESVELDDAAQRVLAEVVRAPWPHPPWDNSAMDGFAVRAEDVRGASDRHPVRLRVVDDVAAGAFPTRQLGPGEAIRVMTGAPVPLGTDGVVRLEHTSAWSADGVSRPALVDVLRDDDAGRNLRRRGEDYAEGEVLMEAGALITPARIGLLAAIGATTVGVTRPPRVAILATGDELTTPDSHEDLRSGRRIADSNSPALAAAVRAAGGAPHVLGIARDEVQDLSHRIDAARDTDVLLVTAGASVGDHDLVKDVLEAAGYQLDFWRVRMRPGSPVSFGRLGRTLVFGLPGNPVSALVTFHVLVAPALRTMLGRRAVHSPTARVVTAAPMPPARGLAHFVRVRLTQGAQGPAQAQPTGPQGSGILTSMGRADALLVVPEGAEGLASGVEADALLLGDSQAARATLGYTTLVSPAADA